MDTLIVGGGLSGLALAEALHAKGVDLLLVEGRDRFGGRILTEKSEGSGFDMGPAWFWSGQPRIAALIERLGLMRFEQFASGALTFEDENGHVQQGRGHASMQGSWRLEGGLMALSQALADRIPDGRKRLNLELRALDKTSAGIRAHFTDGTCVDAKTVVLALPPRIAAQFEYAPALPDDAVQTMQGISTWMAGQAKAVAVYDRPFWREAGLSGDAMSRVGPMVEVHDASPMEGGPYALFGFIGLPPQHRQDEAVLRGQVQDQLVRLYGPEAVAPKGLFVKDWANDPFTSTAADKAPVYAHPTYGLTKSMTGLWDGALHFAGTEVAPQFGGYLEGALEAAENVFARFDV